MRFWWRKKTYPLRMWALRTFEPIPAARREGQVRRGLYDILDGLVLVLSGGRYASNYSIAWTGKMIKRRLAEMRANGEIQHWNVPEED